MSVSSVMERIQAIEAQVAQLTNLTSSTASTATAFSNELNSALNNTTATGTTGTTGATGASVLGRVGATGSVASAQQQVISAAQSALGLPYVWGGNSLRTGVDCSGLVQQAYRTIGIELPRLSADQAKAGTAVASLAEAQPGDLIAWDNSSRNNGADHIAIYLGDGKMIEAPYRGANVRIVDVPSTPDYIRRIIAPESGVSGVSTSVGTSAGESTASAVRASLGAESVATSRSAYELQALFSGLN